MSKKTSPAPLKNSNWGFSCLWAWFIRGLFVSVFLISCAAAIILTLGFVGALLPVLHYVLWGLIGYVVIMREEFKAFREAFYHKSCFFEIGKSFLCCLCQFKKKWCPCRSLTDSCCLKSYCCAESNDCNNPSQCDSEEITESVEQPAPEKKVTPAKKKPTPKKAPVKKEGSS